MTAKEYLAQILACKMRLKTIGWELESLKSVLDCRTTNYEAPKVSLSNVNHTEGLIVTKLDLEQEMNDFEVRLTGIYTTIREMPNPIHGAIISGRYIVMKDWDDIAGELHLGVSRIFQLHRDALAELEKIIVNYS